MSTSDDERTAQAEAGTRKGPIAYFAANPVAANLLMLALFVGGVASAYRLAVQNFPEFDLRTITVSVRSPGSSPQEVEQDINRRVEESVVGLAGVERVVATANEGYALVRIELATFADAGTVLNDVRTAVDAIENFPPPNAERAEVNLARLSVEAMTLAVSSPVASEHELRLAAEEVRNGLLELPSVSLVTLRGTRDREIAIELGEEELRRNDLSMAEVTTAVRRASLNLTFGELRTESGGVVLHTDAKRDVGEEFGDIPLITRLDGTIVTLADVAEIRDGFVDDDIVSEIDGTPAVFVRIEVTEQQSIVDVASEIRGWLAAHDPPPGVAIRIWNDRAQPAVDRMSGIARSGLAGILLVFVLLLLVFDLRAATWITLGIPFSFVGALLLFGPTNLTLNLGTLIGLFLMVGLVVDDALVVGESIASEREGGKRGVEAAAAGARAVVGPITVGACTTILAFVPFLFVTATTAQLVNVFPYVALFVLSMSLLEAFFILPAHLSHDGRWSLEPLRTVQDRVCAWIDRVRDRTVVPAVSWSVRHVSWTLVGGGALVVLSLLLLRAEAVRVVFFDVEMNPTENVQANPVPAGRHAVPNDPGDRPGGCGRGIRDERGVPGRVDRHGQHPGRQHRVDPRADGPRQREPSGRGATPAPRPAAPAGVALGGRAGLAPQHRGPAVRGAGGVPHRAHPAAARRLVRAEARRHRDVEEGCFRVAVLSGRDAGGLRGRGQPVGREAAPGDPAHPGRGGGRADAGRHRDAAQSQLPRRGGPADPARP